MTVTLPVQIIRGVTRTLITSVSAVRSPFTGGQQVQDWGGEWWRYNLQFSSHGANNGRIMSGFFAALGGLRGTFLLADPTIRNPAVLGNPVVDGAGQSGNSLVTAGWSANGLRMGDFFSLGAGAATRLYQITADVTPVAGAATIEFTPRLRASPADAAVLEVLRPKVILRPSGPIPAGIGLGAFYSFDLVADEAL